MLFSAAKQFIKVVHLAGAFQPLIIQGKAFDDVFPQTLGGPDSELCASVRLYPVAYGNNNIEVVVFGSIPLYVGGSCQVFLDN